MKIVNQYKNTKTEKNIDQPASLVLGNDLGNFFYLSEEETRYQGFYYKSNDNCEKKPDIYKVIDEIKILDRDEVVEMKNNFFKVERTSKDGLTESYFLPDKGNSLCLKTSKLAKAEVSLDIRHPYDSRTMGRFYEVATESECLVVKFTKRRDWSEDNLGDKKEFSLFLAVKTDKDSFEKIGEFFSKYYPKDHKRNSCPWDRHIYKAFRMSFKKAVFSVAESQKGAVAEALDVYKNFDKLYKKNRDESTDLEIPKITDPEIKMAYLCAQNSIRTLLVNNKNTGAYAGIPWFFQFWHRDEAISLSKIYRIDKKVGREIIIAQLDAVIKNDSFTRQRFLDSPQDTQSADAIGILARECQKIFKENRVNKDFREDVVKKFEKIVPKLLKERTSDKLALSFERETWMDTLDRSGHRIEIQAGRLALYKFLFSETDNDQYKILLEELEREVIKTFFAEKMLKDSPEDGAVRPNIFLAHHLYPELMLKEKWEKCFDKILPELYLDWGGIASLSQVDSRFISRDSGESSTSYHNGDSWYFMNNLVAAALYQVNAAKYSEHINEIMEASTNEILYMGAIGHHSEISSAEVQQSLGCEAQLWSSAMYLNFFDVAMGE
ncbi:MAG: amylo-alpha-1,6-glucosidase [Candidatus Pacebacteria bacterium]|nr:amylo-alpha-1,6-glucosidase [Candidatus Paceibacterota bacterium]